MGGSLADALTERFSLDERIGSGAFGEVFRGVERATGRAVAVKRLNERATDAVAAARLELEARLLARVASPHVVGYVAHGPDAQGRLCLVLEWLEGEDLARRLSRGPVSHREAVTIARQVCEGLAALHAAGIVHRDVKPSNFFLVAEPDGAVHVKLIDLGVARSTADATLTVDGLRVGTPAYMSPEQARGDDDLSARSDLFSLGVVLYELLAGRRPFSARDPFAVLAKIVLNDPAPLATVAPAVSPALAAVVTRALAKAPAARYASAREMSRALEAAIGLDFESVVTEPELPAAPASAEDAPTTVLGSSSGVTATTELRVVTALFAELDPTARDTERARERFAHVVATHGGATHRTLGARAVAVFGSARARGDEAERAARAALAVRTALGAAARLAVATCRARVTDAGLDDEAIERGVARLGPALAGVPVDDVTARLLEAHFALEGPDGARVLRGERDLDEVAAAGPRLFGRATATVGRDRELAILDAALGDCTGEPAARVVLLTGPPGAGKSRLRYEFLKRARAQQPEAEVLLARADPVGAGSPFGLLGRAIRNAAGVLDGEAVAARRARLLARVSRSVPDEARAETIAALLGEVAGVPFDDQGPGPAAAALRAARADPIRLGDAMAAAWEDWLAAECDAHPVVLVLEDLHWGDLPTVRFVDAALRRLSDRPFLVLALARPDVHAEFPALFAERAVQEVRLAPLGRKACERFVRDALGAVSAGAPGEGGLRVDEATIARVIERAEGNAFYLEELLRALVEGRGAGGGADALPETVLGVVQARLDALAPAARRLLRLASVFGQTFWPGGVRAVAGPVERTGALDDALATLVAQEVVLRRPRARFPGQDEYAFRHALLREAAYAMLTAEDRQRGHALAGAWLEEAGETDAAVLAEHFARAEQPARAAGWYARAAEQALEGNDFAAAIARAERAAECGVDGPMRGAMRTLQAEASRWRGMAADAERYGEEALAALPPGGATWNRAMGESFTASIRGGRAARLVELIEQWAAVEPVDAAAVDAAISAGARGVVALTSVGQLEAAQATLARIRALVERDGEAARDPLALARYTQAAGMEARYRGEYGGHFALAEQALHHFERAGDLRGVAVQSVNVGSGLIETGQYARAEVVLRAALSSADRMGLRRVAACAMADLAAVLARRGAHAEAIELGRAAVGEIDVMGDPRFEGFVRGYLIDALLRAGDLEGAGRAAAEAEAHARARPGARTGSFALIARVHLSRGEPARALEMARAAIAICAEVNAVEETLAQARLVECEALLALGDPGAPAAIAAARDALLAQAALLADPAAREVYLAAVSENARLLALAAEHGV